MDSAVNGRVDYRKILQAAAITQSMSRKGKLLE
jgi:hypothetical protein